ncbi:MAG TPA: hypothetical protein VG274_01835, partial [Rhizomicrobium sp.]|nr:hypothetical protein [Rhizomicrobium sp.]
MREKAVYACGIAGTALMLWNLHTIFMDLPNDALQGFIFRIIFIHVPAALVADVLYTIALITSILFLSKKKFIYDS